MLLSKTIGANGQIDRRFELFVCKPWFVKLPKILEIWNMCFHSNFYCHIFLFCSLCACIWFSRPLFHAVLQWLSWRVSIPPILITCPIRHINTRFCSYFFCPGTCTKGSCRKGTQETCTKGCRKERKNCWSRKGRASRSPGRETSPTKVRVNG